MNDKKITIKQVGYTYVFQVDTVLRKEDILKIHDTIRQQLKEGCVILPAGIRLVSVEPHLEAFVE